MDNKIIASNNDIVFFKKDNGETNIELLINGDTLWVTQKTMAEEEQVMKMKNWITETDNLLKFRKKEILKDSEKISHKQAIEKANEEYEKFRVKQDMQYISSMDEMYQKYLEENNTYVQITLRI